MNVRRPSLSNSLPPPGQEPKVKGVAFRSVLAVLEQIRGEAAVERMLQRMTSEQADTLRYTIVQTGWYPISLYRALWSQILWDTPEQYDLARTIGGSAIRRDVAGVYRVLFKVLSVETLITLSSKLFPYYYDTGKLQNERVSSTCVRSVYEGCFGFDRAMWEELAGSTCELIKMAGGKDVRVFVARGGHHSACILQAEWK